MSAPEPKRLESPHEVPSITPYLRPHLRATLLRFQMLAEVLELGIAEALIEAGLPGDLGDPEAYAELERAGLALFRLSNYVLRRVGPWGDAT